MVFSKRNRKHVLRVSIELYKHSWKFGRTRKSCGNTRLRLVFPQHFSFSQTFTRVCITRYKHGTCFLFLKYRTLRMAHLSGFMNYAPEKQAWLVMFEFPYTWLPWLFWEQLLSFLNTSFPRLWKNSNESGWTNKNLAERGDSNSTTSLCISKEILHLDHEYPFSVAVCSEMGILVTACFSSCHTINATRTYFKRMISINLKEKNFMFID